MPGGTASVRPPHSSLQRTAALCGDWTTVHRRVSVRKPCGLSMLPLGTSLCECVREGRGAQTHTYIRTCWAKSCDALTHSAARMRAATPAVTCRRDGSASPRSSHVSPGEADSSFASFFRDRPSSPSPSLPACVAFIVNAPTKQRGE